MNKAGRPDRASASVGRSEWRLLADGGTGDAALVGERTGGDWLAQPLGDGNENVATAQGRFSGGGGARGNGGSGRLRTKLFGRRRHREGPVNLAAITEQREQNGARVIHHAVEKGGRVQPDERSGLARENGHDLLRFMPVPIPGNGGNMRSLGKLGKP